MKNLFVKYSAFSKQDGGNTHFSVAVYCVFLSPCIMNMDGRY